jgi:predicted nucleic acid-binding protein
VRVYVESNFVLEVVLEQEQHQACEELVCLAESKSIELVIPAFALVEPHQTIVRRSRQRDGLLRDLDALAIQLARTASLAADVPRLREASDLLLRAEQEAWERFLDVRAKLLDKAHMVATDGYALREASTLVGQLGLELPDAVMLASVLGDAANRPAPSVFLNRNKKDFDHDVRDRLRAVDCELILSFHGGLGRVRSALEKAPAPGTESAG